MIHYDLDQLLSTASLEILSETLGELFPEIEVLTLAAGLASLAENPGAGTGPPMAASLTGSLKAANTQSGQTYRGAGPETPVAAHPDLLRLTAGFGPPRRSLSLPGPTISGLALPALSC